MVLLHRWCYCCLDCHQQLPYPEIIHQAPNAAGTAAHPCSTTCHRAGCAAGWIPRTGTPQQGAATASAFPTAAGAPAAAAASAAEEARWPASSIRQCCSASCQKIQPRHPQLQAPLEEPPCPALRRKRSESQKGQPCAQALSPPRLSWQCQEDQEPQPQQRPKQTGLSCCTGPSWCQGI